jgi:hypothetical protein
MRIPPCKGEYRGILSVSYFAEVGIKLLRFRIPLSPFTRGNYVSIFILNRAEFKVENNV